jgi:multidrug efflux pump subunit AcrA (membrane-fusion protein)
VNRFFLAAPAVLILGIGACKTAQPAPLYEKVPVARRDIVVTASASGTIQPILTLSVKSKASGEIIEMPVQTGDDVKKGQLLVKIDPRIPRNDLTQADASLAVAKAQLDNATAQLKRSESLYQSQSIAQTDYDAAKLSYATAQSAVVNAEANLQTAKDAMEDTQVRAPGAGTVLELDAVLGTVISSPTRDVGGGTVILKMANLDTVQVEALVDETDVGKVHSRHRHRGRISQPPVRRQRSEDRAPGAGESERHDVPGAREHPESESPAQTGHEHGGRDPHRPAARRPRRAERSPAHAARRRLGSTGAGDRREDGAAAARPGRGATPRRRRHGGRQQAARR